MSGLEERVDRHLGGARDCGSIVLGSLVRRA